MSKIPIGTDLLYSNGDMLRITGYSYSGKVGWHDYYDIEWLEVRTYKQSNHIPDCLVEDAYDTSVIEIKAQVYADKFVRAEIREGKYNPDNPDDDIPIHNRFMEIKNRYVLEGGA